MNFFIFFFGLTLMISYLFLYFEHNFFLNDIIHSLETKTKRDYELEGFLQYAILYYKTKKNDLTLPHQKNFFFNFDKNCRVNCEYILNSKEENSKEIDIFIKLFVNSKIEGTANCRIRDVSSKIKILAWNIQ